jgi:hypothetical protein
VAKTSFNLPPAVVLQQALSVRCACSRRPKAASPKTTLSIGMTSKLHTYFHTSIQSFWIASWGCDQPWPYFQGSLVLVSFLLNWPLLSLAHLYTLCTVHPCSDCAENLPGSSFQHLLLRYANKTSILVFRGKPCLFHVLFLDFSQTCQTSQFMHCPSQQCA